MEDTFYCFINLDKVSFQLLQELSVKKFFLEEDGTIEEIDGRKETWSSKKNNFSWLVLVIINLRKLEVF